MIRTTLLAAALIAATACSSPPSEEMDARVICPIGDLDAPPEAELVHRDLDNNMVVTSSGTEVPLTIAIQGGHVFYASLRLKNIDGCSVTLTSTLRDPCSDQILSLEYRPINLVPDGDGWGSPENPQDVTNYSSVSSCPRVAAERDIEGEPYLLKIVAEDADGRRAEASTTVIPTCPMDDLYEFCLCECSGDYIVGEECTPDVDPLPPGTCP